MINLARPSMRAAATHPVPWSMTALRQVRTIAVPPQQRCSPAAPAIAVVGFRPQLLSRSASLPPSLRTHRCFSTSKPVAFHSSSASMADWWPFGSKAATTSDVLVPEKSLPDQVNGASASDGVVSDISLLDSIPSSPSTLDSINAASELLASPATVTAAELSLSWWPNVRLVEKLLIYLSETTGAPWWALIIGTTIAVRFAILPIVIKGQANAARLANIQDEVKGHMEQLTQYKKIGDIASLQRTSVDVQSLFRKHNCHPLKSFILPFTQMPIFISFFFALRALADQGLQTMKDGGSGWLTDLTLADPTYVAPVLSAVTSLAVMETGAEFGPQSPAANAQTTKTIRWVLRGVTCLVPFFVYHLPAAIFYYWITNNFFSLIQVIFLQVPAVRKYFDMPPPKARPTFRSLPSKSAFSPASWTSPAPKEGGNLGRPMTFAESLRAGYDSQAELLTTMAMEAEEKKRSQNSDPVSSSSKTITGMSQGDSRRRAYEKWINIADREATSPPSSTSTSTASSSSSPESEPETSNSLFEAETAGEGSSSSSSSAARGAAISNHDLIHREAEAAEKRRRVAQARERRLAARRAAESK